MTVNTKPLTDHEQVNRYLQANMELDSLIEGYGQPFHEYLRETFKEDLPKVIADVLVYYYDLSVLIRHFEDILLENLNLFAFHPDHDIQMLVVGTYGHRYPIKIVREIILHHDKEVAKRLLWYPFNQWLLPDDADRELIDYVIENKGHFRFLNHPDPKIAAHARAAYEADMEEKSATPEDMENFGRVYHMYHELRSVMESVEDDTITKEAFDQLIQGARQAEALFHDTIETVVNRPYALAGLLDENGEYIGESDDDDYEYYDYDEEYDEEYEKEFEERRNSSNITYRTVTEEELNSDLTIF